MAGPHPGRRIRIGAAWMLLVAGAVIAPTPPAQAATVSLQPGDDIQAAVDASPPGTVFHLAAGVYANQQVVPKDGQQFIGQGANTVLSGARTLTDWSRRRGQWYVTGQTQEGQVHGQCEGGWSRCDRPEDLFVDGVTYRHVSSRGQLGPGTWFFDYSADRIYLGEDPAGKVVETSVTRHAFFGAADGVVIRNMVIEKYAVPAQHGAIDSRSSNIGTHGTNWTIDGVEGRLNHGGALYLTSGGTVSNCFFHHNGQQGMSATGSGIVVSGSEFAYNNTAHFNLDWEGGASKFWSTTGLVFLDNHSHHNYGTGVWLDYENSNSLIEGNTVSWNYREGIYVEVSLSATVRGNHVEGNGVDDPRGDSWLWSGGITVASSRDVEISGNTLVNNGNGITATQQNRGSGSGGAWLVENLNVHGNDVTMSEGQTGIVQDVGDNAVFLSRNNHFEANTYRGDGQALLFAWNNSSHPFPEWRALFGHDWEGRFVSNTGDTVAPILTLLGANPMALEVNGLFEDPGATATDDFDPRVTVFTRDTVDTSTPGYYEVSYRAVDSAGNEAVGSRTVVVGEPPALPQVTVSTVSNGAEPSSPGRFAISRAGDGSGALTVTFALSGTATAGVDYGDPGRTIVLADGTASAELVLIPVDDGAFEGPETVTVSIETGNGYVVGTPATATLTITDDDEQAISFWAISESTAQGAITSGDYRSTAAADDQHETLAEEVYAGGQRSRLAHEWVFEVAGSTLWTLEVEAHRDGGPDAFAFEVSADGASWTRLVTITALSDEIVTAPLPAGTTGTVFLRVVDTDRSRGEPTEGRLFVDYLAITAG